jgi:hypothetical protein
LQARQLGVGLQVGQAHLGLLQGGGGAVDLDGQQLALAHAQPGGRQQLAVERQLLLGQRVLLAGCRELPEGLDDAAAQQQTGRSGVGLGGAQLRGLARGLGGQAAPEVELVADAKAGAPALAVAPRQAAGRVEGSAQAAAQAGAGAQAQLG